MRGSLGVPGSTLPSETVKRFPRRFCQASRQLQSRQSNRQGHPCYLNPPELQRKSLKELQLKLF